MKAYIHPASPNCVAVLTLAQELSVPLETETVDLFAHANTAPEFLSINPNGLVPVLIDGDFVLWETTAILQYLAVSNLECNTLRFNGWFHGTGLQAH